MTLASFFCLFQKPRYIAMLPSCCFLGGCCCSILLLMRTLMMMMRAPAHDEKVTNNWKNKKQKVFSEKMVFFFLQTAHKSRSRSSVFLLVHIAQVVLHPSLWLISTPIKTTPNRHKKDNNLSLYCGTLFYFGFSRVIISLLLPIRLMPVPYEFQLQLMGEQLCFVNYNIRRDRINGAI